MQTEFEFRQHLLEQTRGYRLSQVLITCAELGVFEALGSGAASSEELASCLEVHPLALSRLLDAAVALGWVEKQSRSYLMSPVAAACLSFESPFYLGNYLKREGAFYRRWSNLSQAVRTGQRPEENKKDEVVNTNWVQDFEMALYDIARTAAPAVAVALGPTLPQKTMAKQPIRVLDVGGGHGAYSIALAEKYPDLEAIIFELPAAATVAQSIRAKSRVADRVTVQAGDFKVNDLGSEFDLVLLFGVLVSETAEGALALLGKVHKALRADGQVVIRGSYLNPDHNGPIDANLFDLHMLLSNSAGGAHTLNELTAWLAASGFEAPKTLNLPAPEQSSLILARKKISDSPNSGE
jgi:SAM-dependent methyltransferase